MYARLTHTRVGWLVRQLVETGWLNTQKTKKGLAPATAALRSASAGRPLAAATGSLDADIRLETLRKNATVTCRARKMARAVLTTSTSALQVRKCPTTEERGCDGAAAARAAVADADANAETCRHSTVMHELRHSECSEMHQRVVAPPHLLISGRAIAWS